jgi:integrase
VPLHPTADRALRAYLVRRQRVFRDSTHMFVSGAGTPLAPNKVCSVFLSLLRQLGLRAPTGPGPHLHDLRHTFATRSLEACPTEAARVGRHLVALSTYLGHAGVSDTFWYLHATPALTRGISAQCTAALERLLP